MAVLQVLYVLSAIGLALVGFNTLILSILYLAHRRDAETPLPAVSDEDLPPVLVQLPIYNERHVVERLLEAAAALDYPRDRLRVQLLDDSTDDTIRFALPALQAARAAGLRVEHVQRADRVGYKAGALAYGLAESTEPLIAIFDADFTPPPQFLRQVVPYFTADDGLGMVQARWAHLNARQSALTRAEALALDAHFVVEQTARHRSGLLMNFSGTGGVWRRTCIEDSGGWQHDTLSEDIDISYRAQLRGWRFLYLPDVSAPAEIPPLMQGFKRQQARWATGTVQCLRKLGPTLLRSHLTPWQKAQGLLHLSGYFLHPLLLIMLLLKLPLLLSGQLGALPLAGLGLAMLGSPVQAVISQRRLYADWRQRLAYFPVFMLMGVGIAVSNTVAVAQAFSARPLPFRRTPKFRAAERAGASWAASSYVLPPDATTLIEVALSGYSAVLAALAVTRFPALVPFLVLYALGFAFAAGLTLWQARIVRRVQPARPPVLKAGSSRGR